MKPETIQDAVSAVRAAFPEDQLAAWASQPESPACLQAHFGLGTWIRNNMVHGDGSPLFRLVRAGDGFIHEDDFSTMVLKALWRVLNGFPCPSLEELTSKAQCHAEGLPEPSPAQPGDCPPPPADTEETGC